MELNRQELLPQPFQRGANFQNLLNERQQELAAAHSVAPQTAQAVTAPEVADPIDPSAQRNADLQAVIERFNNAAAEGDIPALLSALQSLAQEQTNSEFASPALQKIAELATEVFGLAADNPGALENVAFSFSANFSQQSVMAGDYRYNETSFSLSFTYQTDDTILTGSFSFAEALEQDADSLSYQSYESASIGIVTHNANLETNPLLKAYDELRSSLLGNVLGGDQGEAAIPYGNGAYSKISVFESLQIEVSSVNTASSLLEDLLQQMEEFQKRLRQENILGNDTLFALKEPRAAING